MKAALLCVLLLAGCASLPAGVEMSDEERKACAAASCSVWTPAELEGLVIEVYRRGVAAGKQWL